MIKLHKNTGLLALAIVFTFGMFTSTICTAGDIKAGKTKASACFGCHGQTGISVMPNYPNLAGQKEQYLISAINQYRNGGRNDPTMKAMVAPLNDTDVANIAAYFSSLARK